MLNFQWYFITLIITLCGCGCLLTSVSRRHRIIDFIGKRRPNKGKLNEFFHHSALNSAENYYESWISRIFYFIFFHQGASEIYAKKHNKNGFMNDWKSNFIYFGLDFFRCRHCCPEMGMINQTLCYLIRINVIIRIIIVIQYI